MTATMSVLRLIIWLGTLGVLWGGLPLLAGPFVPPADDVVVVRRDRLPLDVERMQELSQQLGSLAQGQGGERASDRRVVAQLVALALVLHPDNREVRNFVDQYGKGEQQAKGDPKKLAEARARVWETQQWLASPTAGADGNTLANCLGDVMMVVDPKHPRALELRPAGEKGAWSNWVKPPADFLMPSSVVPDEPTKTTTPPPPPPAIQLAQATVTTVMRTAGEKPGADTVMRVVPIVMTAKPQAAAPGGRTPAPTPPFSCAWDWEESKLTAENFETLCKRVREPLVAARGPLPAGVGLRFSYDNKRNKIIEKDRSAITGALAVLMNAAVSGTEPQAIVIGEIDNTGAFRLPPRFWERLRALADGPGGRLVIPAEAATVLPSLLALEESGFFCKYEVLLATNLQELIARCAKTPQGDLADISTQFDSVRTKLGNQSVPEYVANRFVRQRLDMIAQAAPFHGSARMLVMQGSGKRPTTLPRTILAAELLLATRPLASLAAADPNNLKPGPLSPTLETCKKNFTRLARYAENRDRDLLDLTNDLTVALRTYSRKNEQSEFNLFKAAYDKATAMLHLASDNP